ncbi:hypothetical protein ANCCAN_20654 [Ancylostoma caninum]|uniref:Uncharacterized protein n=1 Tax=Ancylostoma caninum TaxID=29170 RepID=A0A368FTF1_ANCCA|nr:hypothetical protein ANCCAN_20654 [Ancylostoma caninum]
MICTLLVILPGLVGASLVATSGRVPLRCRRVKENYNSPLLLRNRHLLREAKRELIQATNFR